MMNARNRIVAGLVLAAELVLGCSQKDAAPTYTAAELASFKTLAEATIKALDAPGSPGMAAKLTDLESAWDAQENVLKPKDSGTWTLLDKTIDKALSALRGSKTDIPKGRAALQELIKELGQATKSQ